MLELPDELLTPSLSVSGTGNMWASGALGPKSCIGACITCPAEVPSAANEPEDIPDESEVPSPTERLFDSITACIWCSASWRARERERTISFLFPIAVGLALSSFHC